jgi:hypothetical protein
MGAEGTISWPLALKNSKKHFLISLDVIVDGLAKGQN